MCLGVCLGVDLVVVRACMRACVCACVRVLNRLLQKSSELSKYSRSHCATLQLYVWMDGERGCTTLLCKRAYVNSRATCKGGVCA